MSTKVEHTRFNAEEASRITGVLNSLQRDWRRRGYLPAKEGTRASYSPQELAYLMVLRRLTDMGVTPSSGRQLAHNASVYVIMHAHNQPGAVLPEGEMHVVMDHVKRYFVRLDNDLSPFFSDTLEEVMSANKATQLFAIDLEQLGKDLVQAAGRPLATVVVEP